MPNIDVTEVLVDPDFAETITMIRRQETINTFGEGIITEVPTDILAVVIQMSPGYYRDPNYDIATNAIMVYTTAILRGDVYAGKPDLIVWKGNRYIVKRCSDWSNYGAGFTKNECWMIDTARQP